MDSSTVHTWKACSALRHDGRLDRAGSGEWMPSGTLHGLIAPANIPDESVSVCIVATALGTCLPTVPATEWGLGLALGPPGVGNLPGANDLLSMRRSLEFNGALC